MTSSIRRNPIIRAVAVLALALGLFAAVPSVSGAADACQNAPYGSSATLTGSPTTVAPGGTVTIVGSGFGANCVLSISVGTSCPGTHITDVTTDGNGHFELTWTVPADQQAGQLTFCATGGDSVTVNTTVTVKSATTATSLPATGGNGGSGTLPKTGSQVMPFIGGGVLLLVIGSLLVLSSRKRHSAS